jgi:hypothetical protein
LHDEVYGFGVDLVASGNKIDRRLGELETREKWHGRDVGVDVEILIDDVIIVVIIFLLWIYIRSL